MDRATREDLERTFRSKRVVIVGSGPGSMDNVPGFVDSHDVVVRVNNFRCVPETGFHTDVFYSFFGGSIKKTADELKRHGVKLCMCKCPETPDGPFIDSVWHRRNGKLNGVEFQYIYRDRATWWFCPTYVPPLEEFLEVFRMLDQHIPSTGFSAVLAVMACKPESLFLTGFDFFSSGVHNLNERWRPGNPDDPIGHAPALERAWLARNMDCGIRMDPRLTAIMEGQL